MAGGKVGVAVMALDKAGQRGRFMIGEPEVVKLPGVEIEHRPMEEMIGDADVEVNLTCIFCAHARNVPGSDDIRPQNDTNHSSP